MKLLSLVAATLALVATTASADPSVEALNLPAMSKHPLSMQRREAMLNKRRSPSAKPRMVVKRHAKRSKRTCKAKTSQAASSAASKPVGDAKSNAQQSKVNSQNHTQAHADAGASSQSNSDSKSSSSASSHSNASSQSSSSGKSDSKSSSSSSSSSSSAASGSGLFGLSTNNCGSSGANDQQPNGSQNFLNCGLTSGGWNPPKLGLDQIKILSGQQAADSAVFAPCKPLLWAFQAAEKAHGIPATVLMSFAMQESTCNPNVTGGNGEQGLMQITPDKCGGAPGGNCKDPWFNVNTGAKYFKDTLDSYGGNLLQAMGMYNGWQPGLTVEKATAARWQGNCFAQNNLDYLYQMLNGWFLGKANTYDMGTYKNLAACK
ncbi:uncharacterized protein UMAG_06218 [Mycosarcoma maydis]|uniref:Transglycosylase SLT domain-containing protein n=1 Tax=Mycosarcoma maydis TaxID=5270 RepID=A0A0D1DTB4_MYCMD|nr:uncharacterized protein UMAG_06218 [Ustilago maydis 521]KIS65840.1 hypothetical protein UMAG_06218 [Ustilago maydis 521]|eukprot:XP_011392575.1 hypothetical protein UMAG_06218 [Ustilago maydis 521]